MPFSMASRAAVQSVLKPLNVPSAQRTSVFTAPMPCANESTCGHQKGKEATL
jgi:hypothetical protein